jgi:hypothetical protein
VAHWKQRSFELPLSGLPPNIAEQLRPPADQPDLQAAFRQGALNNIKSIGSMPLS